MIFIEINNNWLELISRSLNILSMSYLIIMCNVYTIYYIGIISISRYIYRINVLFTLLYIYIL